MKKLLSLILAIAVMICAMPLGAFTLTASALTSGHYNYWVGYYSKVTITGVAPSISGDVIIPSTIGGYPVASIGENAFSDCCNLTSLTIPDSVTSIGDNAFSGCSKLKSVTIPDSVTNIGDDAFAGCTSLTGVYITDIATWCDIDFPNGYSNPLNYAKNLYLKGELVTNLVIPDSVTSIGDWSFSYCNSLTSATISDNVTSIGAGAFSNCYNLSSIAIPDGVESIGDDAFSNCYNLSGIAIPDGVASIGDYAFLNCNSLTSITIPDSVTSIGAGAFSNCYNLISITIPNSVTSIGDYTFYFCDSLTNITIPKSVTSIGDYAFRYCDNLTSITIPGSYTSIGDYAFSGCTDLVSITILHGVIKIGDYAFYDCTNLKNVYYSGSKIDKEKISIGTGNIPLIIATWYYSICSNNDHKYSNCVDTSCNSCGFVRLAMKHIYTNNCDKSCNACKATRTIKHTYENSCDTLCNVCKVTRSITHKYKTTTTKATLTKNGSVVEKCTVCGEVASTSTIKYVKSFKLSTTSYTYNGKVKTPNVIVKDSAGKTLKKNTDYTVTYAKGRRNAGTYKVTIKMKGKYSGSKTLSFKIKPISVSKCEMALSNTRYTYNGKSKIPSVTVLNHKGTKLTDCSYTLTYAKGRKNVGAYKVTVKMKGNYSGTKTLTFKINPAKTTVSKLTAGKKSITVNISRKSTQVSGYQVQYSTSKKFTSAKTKTISSYKTTKYTLKSLSAKKVYYVRVRTYKTVSGKKYYSSWSTAKSVKTK